MEKSQKPSLSRALYMILFLIIGRFASIAVCLSAIFQFIYALIFSKPNEKVLKFTHSLAEYVKAIVAYVSFNSESKPWPIGEWPDQSA